MVTTRHGSKLTDAQKLGAAVAAAHHASKDIVHKKKVARKAKAARPAGVRVRFIGPLTASGMRTRVMHRRKPIMKRYALAPGMMRPKGMWRGPPRPRQTPKMKAHQALKFHHYGLALAAARHAAMRGFARKYVYGPAMYTGSKKYHQKVRNPKYSAAKRAVLKHYKPPHFSRLILS